MKTICANEQTVIGPKPKYFVSQTAGEVICRNMRVRKFRIIIVDFIRYDQTGTGGWGFTAAIFVNN